MIVVKKDFTEIPATLIDKTRKKHFENNKDAKKYTSKTAYKTKDVQTKLSEIYHNKCAYCEKNIDDTDKHIDHYRPKSKYFWLAFSWDNLLLSCGQCNRDNKKDKFEIEGAKQEYENYKLYSLGELQNIIKKLDEKEKPLIVNPEQVTQIFLDNNLSFYLFDELAGKIFSTEKRLKHTISLLGLNRKELLKKRLTILNDIKNTIKRRKDKYVIFGNENKFIEELKTLKNDEIEKLTPNREFIAFREAIINELFKIYLHTD